jgi:hypothetical protein
VNPPFQLSSQVSGQRPVGCFTEGYSHQRSKPLAAPETGHEERKGVGRPPIAHPIQSCCFLVITRSRQGIIPTLILRFRSRVGLIESRDRVKWPFPKRRTRHQSLQHQICWNRLQRGGIQLRRETSILVCWIDYALHLDKCCAHGSTTDRIKDVKVTGHGKETGNSPCCDTHSI